MPRERQRRAATFAIAALAIAAGAVGFGLAPRDEAVSPADAASPSSSPRRDGDAHAVAADVAEPSPIDSRTDALRGGVRGRVLDAAGAPLVGFKMALIGKPRGRRKVLEAEPEPHVLAAMPADRDGAVTFDELSEGEYRVQLVDAPHVAQKVRIEPGQWLQVELRLDLVAVTGTLQRGGVVSDRHPVCVRDAAGGEWVAWPGRPPTLRAGVGGDRRGGPSAGEPAIDAAERGVIRLALKPGRYLLHVLRPSFGVELGGPKTVLGEHELVVPSGVATTRFCFPIAGAELVVRVTFPNGERVPAFGVDVNRPESGERAYLAASSPDGGPLHVDDVPPGRWRVHVHSPQIAPLPEQEFEATAVASRVELDFAARPAAPVFLSLRSGARDVNVPPDLLPNLVSGQDQLPCDLRDRSVERANASQLVWNSVPTGSAVVQWVDRVVAGEHVFLPFEPQPPSQIVVALGVRNELRLDVVPRACIDLRACDRGGREDAHARVAVFAGAVPVRATKGLAAQRWRGWLPVGDYRVVVTRGGVAREQPLRVDRADRTLRLRP